MKLKFKNEKTLFLLDQDGTLYKGADLFPQTKDFLAKLKQNNANYVFITNNSSKSVDNYIAKMHAFGITTTRDDFYTSANAATDYLRKHHPNAKVYLIGTEALATQLRASGIVLVDSHKANVALLGYDTELTYQKLINICELLRNPNVTYLATNPDLVCPTEDGYIPDCGSFAQMIEHATGRMPLFLGKPEKMFIDTVLEHFNCAKENAVIVGDRLYTDLQAGINSNVDTVVVLSGEATRETIEKNDSQPTFIVNHIGEIL